MGQSRLWLQRSLLLLVAALLGCLTPAKPEDGATTRKARAEAALQVVHDVATENLGALCVTEPYRSLPAGLDTSRYEGARQKADMAASMLQDLGLTHHASLLDALVRSLVMSDRHVVAARLLSLDDSSGSVLAVSAWQRARGPAPALAGPTRDDAAPVAGRRPDAHLPWFEDAASSPALRSPKFVPSPVNASYRGWWTYPYYSCHVRLWLVSYSIAIQPSSHRGTKGYLSLDVNVTPLEVNQCEASSEPPPRSELRAFHSTHKCHNDTTQCELRPSPGWVRGGYVCRCREGFYSPHHGGVFNGTLVEAAWQEREQNVSSLYDELFRCFRCAPGCATCRDPSPCLAPYNWPFRLTLLSFSVLCALCTLGLVCYVYQHRRLKVFKVASPIFLGITLLGCSIMYLEMAAIFPVLDMYSCIATKWSRHLGFCITYTALLMKTWRVSLTYRVKSAHKVKLTDKQLLQWMFPILLVMLIYLGTWTLSAPPTAEEIHDSIGLRFKQCSYNWWDHSLAIGEVLFLAWGIRVCYNVRNAESLYNEARLISYAIYNIAIVNITMIAFHLFIFPHAGPDIKYLLGFIRTQLSTSVTVGLVFGPKIVRVLRGQGDQWDNRARARGVTASFSLNGIGLMPEETPDLYQENEELKEEIQKLAAQIEFMKIVHMEMNNRHLKPKPGGYFNAASTAVTLQSPLGKTSGFVVGKSSGAEESCIVSATDGASERV
ncbi:probable G-protein coupled receptor CG31760 [Schistocerca cancellata]|uniref:probable G-protein coupled receptor CG31760 n=1 Tax=Schistocerca cancellata TaxID=274614 RepID=UPI002119317E|nr:probable G-protein coupled receptor CG31760 [Schistocerca cancellata]